MTAGATPRILREPKDITFPRAPVDARAGIDFLAEAAAPSVVGPLREATGFGC